MRTGENSERELEGYNHTQTNAIRSYRRKMEKMQKCHLSNNTAAIYWVEGKLADYFHSRYRANEQQSKPDPEN